MSKPKPSCAFAEATGGAIGALWTTLLFYPIDVAKIRLQADADDEEEEEGERQQSQTGTATDKAKLVPAQQQPHHHTRTYVEELRLLLTQPELWYAGVGPKASQALLSSFIYFYVYASLKGTYSRVTRRPVTFLSNLLLASLAGVCNVLVTLPMDVVVTRLQTASRGHRLRFWEVVRALAAEGPQTFWQGLIPALLLTCNPAINYAAYDAMKAVVAGLRRRQRATSQDAFLVGMLSKFIATVITYPLIRSKVVMMSGIKERRVLQKRASSAALSSSPATTENGHATTTTSSPAAAASTSSPAKAGQPPPGLPLHEHMGLLEVMSVIVREGGLPALYVGVDAQVLNTALKNAVLLNTKERISRIATFLLRQLYARPPE